MVRKGCGSAGSVERIYSTRCFPESISAVDSSKAIGDATKIAGGFIF